ncbi:MAG: GDP-mannose 4,6-dehydratase [Oscillospiraceae bacterium]|nr:GDP-mannose 4,6-dehydratase [Oscillospiraceae bacterium]
MKRSLIIGAAGFVGGYLIKHLSSLGDEVFATKLPAETMEADCTVRDLDILDEGAAAELISEVRPDRIFHLAAQSSVALSWNKPALTARINVVGAINVLEAARNSECDPVILLIGSSEEYGEVNTPDGIIGEDRPACPNNIYAATKSAQNTIGGIYQKAYGMKIICVRAFNHFGPGQLPQFVISDFCKQTAEIEAGLHEPIISVGNLSAKRDFTDVRDIVRAYGALAEKGIPGETYNVGSGHAIEIRSILDIILSLSKAEISIEVDKTRLRPVDVPVVQADIRKINNDTGWKPEIDIMDTIGDTLNYWRNVIETGK